MKRSLALLAAFSVSVAFLPAEEHKAHPATPVDAKPQPAPAGASVYLISPREGKPVKSPVLVRFGLRGMGVAPAGVNMPNTGHHHLIIDGAKVDMTLPIPMSDQVKHFGAGQTEASIELAPGKHTLQLVIGDYLHIPHNPPVASKVVTITVEK